jgi:FlaA1/EpsC-like NDP-sugar epimerase
VSRQQAPIASVNRWWHRLLPGEAGTTLFAVAADFAVVCAAYTAAFLLRFESEVPRASMEFGFRWVPLIAIAYLAANVIFGVYRTVWAYGGLGDVINLVRPILAVTALLFVANLALSDRDLPLSVILMAGALIFPGMAFVKMRTRLLHHVSLGGGAGRRLLIVGAGHTGQALARELQTSPGLRYQPIGYLDDDARKHHRRMLGLRVFGPIADLDETIEERSVDAVAIAIGRVPGARIREIVGVCQRRGVPVRIVPGVENWMASGGQAALRDVTLEDLLGREAVEIDYERCAQTVRDRVVLVTGAAGSIGSELCRQVLTFRPRELHLVDNNETGLFDLSLELHTATAETTIRLCIADVTDEERMRQLFDEVRPDVVYHAAAYKHVPLMEEHPLAAFRVNVLGTRNVAAAAREYGVSSFVLISTDKAVRPTSIMGATKRIAELLVLALAKGTEETKFSVVRFGNVMGSRGSVVPIFMRQIENGGPVTVMHRDMMRYFISIPEAVSLVIQAGAFAGRGEVYMLDMGEEVNILELAERMIRLRGLQPGKDIEVVFTGPRPGEKLREELVAAFERMEGTEHPKVMRLASEIDVVEPEINRLINETGLVAGADAAELRRRIHLVARRYSTEEERAAEAAVGPA